MMIAQGGCPEEADPDPEGLGNRWSQWC